MAEVDFLKKSDGEKYDLFLKRNSDSYIFHTPEWKTVLEQTFNLKSYYIIAKDSTGNICGVLPLFYVNGFSNNKLVSLPYSTYGGLIADIGYADSILKKAFDLKEKLKCDFLQIRQPPNKKYEFLLEENGMNKVEIRVDQYLFLEPPECLIGKLGRSSITSIKKANNYNVSVKQVSVENEVNFKKIYTLETITKRRKGYFPPHINYFYNLWKYLHPKDYLKIYFSEKDGKLLSYDIFLTYKDRILGINNGTNKMGRKTGANPLMIWNAIKQSYADGFKIFDLGSTPDVNKGFISDDFKGLYDFKKSLNTTSIPYSYFYYPKNIGMEKGNLRELSNFERFGRMIIKRAPVSILKKIGPYFTKKYFL